MIVTRRHRSRDRAQRSRDTRAALPRRASTRARGSRRRTARTLSCGNLAHGFAACGAADKAALRGGQRAEPRHRHRLQRHALGASAATSAIPRSDQAGGARGRRHRAGRRRRAGDVRRRHAGPAGHGAVAVLARRDRAWRRRSRCRTTCSTPRCILGVCDKIVPGLLIGALTFGHLPAVFVPGRADDLAACRNDEKAAIRQLYAEGKVGRDELLEAEAAVLPRARHLHLLRHRQLQPDADGDHGPAPAGRELRQSRHAAARCADRARRPSARWRSPRSGNDYTPVGHVIDEKRDRQRRRRPASPPAARPTTPCTWSRWRAAAGIALDLGGLRRPVATSSPLLARVYPNGAADVNHFHAAGGMALPDPRAARRRACCTRTCSTVCGDGPARLRASSRSSTTDELRLARRRRREPATATSCAPVDEPFRADGGLRCSTATSAAR